MLAPCSSGLSNAIVPLDEIRVIGLRDKPENIKRMVGLIKQVDAKFVSEVVSVKYERAQSIADALNSLDKNSSAWKTSKLVCKNKMKVLSNAWERLSESFKGSGSVTTSDILNTGMDKIIADERTNSLLLYGSEDDVKVLKKTIAQLDVARKEVLIEAVIFEFAGSYRTKSSARKGCDSWKADHKRERFLPAMAFAPVAMTNNSREISNRFANVQAFKGDLDTLVTELANDNRVRILQRPRIQTSDEQPASIFVGESPYPVSGHYYDYGGCYSSIQQLQMGVTLEVNPHLTTEDSLSLDIHQTVESANGSVNIANVGTVPITSRREFQAQVKVADRQTILLGGLIESAKDDNHKGIFLIGRLFRKPSVLKQKEMMVAIRPMILPPPNEVATRSR